ncbi:MAG: AAA family ATPase [Gammaproteobacteria bacterium]|nr:AAA family ATPase [Gammaproteobacteria bacterium]
MKIIAFFNNKGGVGKTSLVYHLAWMFGDLGYRVLAADLDPQANLSGMFLDENRLEELWTGSGGCTIDRDIAPLFEGTGDISIAPHIEKLSERIGLLSGDLALSKREDELSAQWPKCLDEDDRAFRVVTAFSRLIQHAGSFQADIALIDVGPNLGAINRVALIASDHVIIPLAPDLFSLQGLRNVGPTLKKWRKDWRKRLEAKPDNLDVELPSGNMQPAGYVIMRHSVRLSRPVQAYARWISQAPSTYMEYVLEEQKIRDSDRAEDDEHCLAHLKDYRSLMPMAQETRKPMFMLKPADGAIGAHQAGVAKCYNDFKILAEKIITTCGIPALDES